MTLNEAIATGTFARPNAGVFFGFHTVSFKRAWEFFRIKHFKCLAFIVSDTVIVEVRPGSSTYIAKLDWSDDCPSIKIAVIKGKVKLPAPVPLRIQIQPEPIEDELPAPVALEPVVAAKPKRKIRFLM